GNCVACAPWTPIGAPLWNTASSSRQRSGDHSARVAQWYFRNSRSNRGLGWSVQFVENGMVAGSWMPARATLHSATSSSSVGSRSSRSGVRNRNRYKGHRGSSIATVSRPPHRPASVVAHAGTPPRVPAARPPPGSPRRPDSRPCPGRLTRDRRPPREAGDWCGGGTLCARFDPRERAVEIGILSLWPVFLVGLILVAVLVWVIVIHNRLIRQRNRVRASWA